MNSAQIVSEEQEGLAIPEKTKKRFGADAMKITPTHIPDILILEPTVFGDERGFFFESYNERIWRKLTGLNISFVQQNHSRSFSGVLRGLHYQINKPQGKLVRVIVGEIYDVVVDIRRSSTTFGQWFGMRLSAANKKQLWIPAGFAHGFLVISDSAEVLYMTTDFWYQRHERCIKWNDPDLNIDWPLSQPPILSDKDQRGTTFNKAELFT